MRAERHAAGGSGAAGADIVDPVRMPIMPIIPIIPMVEGMLMRHDGDGDPLLDTVIAWAIAAGPIIALVLWATLR